MALRCLHKPAQCDVKHLLREQVDVCLLFCTNTAPWLHLDHILVLLFEKELQLHIHFHGDLDRDLCLLVDHFFILNSFNQDVVEVDKLHEETFCLNQLWAHVEHLLKLVQLALHFGLQVFQLLKTCIRLVTSVTRLVLILMRAGIGCRASILLQRDS